MLYPRWLLEPRQVDELLNDQTNVCEQWVDVAAVSVESATVSGLVPDVLEPGHRLLAPTGEIPFRLLEALVDQVSEVQEVAFGVLDSTRRIITAAASYHPCS